ncbi:MAG: glycosyl transferase, partial [Candidatus Atribacteria bacterium]|nr:glycosyl transferase [Candidatus Atribacteria bacterium]
MIQKKKYMIQNKGFIYFILKVFRSYLFYFINKITRCQLEKISFYKHFGYPLNLKKPKSFNEKIAWKKVYDRNPLLPITADKYEVRSYLKEVLGEQKAKEILIPMWYVTDQPETIPFESLPPDFIIKPNHASGKSIVIEHGSYDP